MNLVLLVLTLAVTMLTFSSARTNVLLGAVHLLLFLAYVMLIFERLTPEYVPRSSGNRHREIDTEVLTSISRQLEIEKLKDVILNWPR